LLRTKKICLSLGVYNNFMQELPNKLQILNEAITKEMIIDALSRGGKAINDTVVMEVLNATDRRQALNNALTKT